MSGTTDSGAVAIRPAAPADAATLHAMIVGLAEYEREPDKVKGTPEQLADALFGEHPAAEAILAEIAGEPVGFALFFDTFSTWECNRGIWLEDLYVEESARRAGVGRALLGYLAELTLARGYARLEWVALDWNTPALSFYAARGAALMDQWKVHRLTGAALAHAAAQK